MADEEDSYLVGAEATSEESEARPGACSVNITVEVFRGEIEVSFLEKSYRQRKSKKSSVGEVLFMAPVERTAADVKTSNIEHNLSSLGSFGIRTCVHVKF